MNRIRIQCNCKTCGGAAALAPEGLITGSTKTVRDLTHSYVSYAHGTSPMAQMLSLRAGVEAA